jgi:hypothetical protein
MRAHHQPPQKLFRKTIEELREVVLDRNDVQRDRLVPELLRAHIGHDERRPRQWRHVILIESPSGGMSRRYRENQRSEGRARQDGGMRVGSAASKRRTRRPSADATRLHVLGVARTGDEGVISNRKRRRRGSLRRSPRRFAERTRASLRAPAARDAARLRCARCRRTSALTDGRRPFITSGTPEAHDRPGTRAVRPALFLIIPAASRLWRRDRQNWVLGD